MSGYLWASRAFLAAALLATAGALWLAVNSHPLPALTVAWTAPNLLVLAAGCRIAHNRTRHPRRPQ